LARLFSSTVLINATGVPKYRIAGSIFLNVFFLSIDQEVQILCPKTSPGSTVLCRLNAILRFERAAKRTRVLEPTLPADVHHRQISTAQKIRCMIKPDPHKIAVRCQPESVFELPHQLRNGEAGSFTDRVQIQFFPVGRM
jgi:hypothetical protein